MGAEILIPLAISALGSGAQAYNTYRTMGKQDEEAAVGIRAQAGHQRQADEAVNNSVDQLGQSSPEGARAKATDDFLSQLRRNQGQAVPGASPGGSSRYAEDSAGAETDVADFGAKAASTMARISAPGMQREQEGVNFNRLSTSLGTIGRNASGDQFLTQLRSRSIRENPWVNAGVGVATGAANGMASRPASPKAPADWSGRSFQGNVPSRPMNQGFA